MSKKEIKWWVIGLLAVIALLWGVFGWWQDRTFVMWRWITEMFVERFFLPKWWNLLGATPVFYLLVALVATGLVFWFTPDKYTAAQWRKLREKLKRQKTRQREAEQKAARDAALRNSRWSNDDTEDKEEPEPEPKPKPIPQPNWRVVGPLVAVAVISGLAFVPAVWNNDRDTAASYSGSTVFVVQDLNSPPESLKYLFDGKQMGSNPGCTRIYNNGGFNSCVLQGEFSPDWYPRASSATGATKILTNNSATDNNSQLLQDSLAYIYDADGSGKWTAIRDGKGTNPIVGVMEWNGSGDRATNCNFSGNYALNKAFGGVWGNNLGDEIAHKFRNLLYDDADVWGYCRGTEREPVIVIPVYQQQGFNHRTTIRSAGVIVVTGSPSGKPSIVHDIKVDPGKYPGPVYPTAVADQQREQLKWHGGRWVKTSNGKAFGYKVSGLESQQGNDSDYLLKSKSDNGLYWVTPLRLNGSDSEQIIAYSVTPADKATAGQLNEQRVYVLNGNDERVADLSRMENAAKNAANVKQNGFTSSGGSIKEFLPVDGTNWQVFAEMGGDVVYRITIPVNTSITPTVTEVKKPQEKPTEVDVCTKPRSQLSSDELAGCIQKFAEELGGRKDK